MSYNRFIILFLEWQKVVSIAESDFIEIVLIRSHTKCAFYAP